MTKTATAAPARCFAHAGGPAVAPAAAARVLHNDEWLFVCQHHLDTYRASNVAVKGERPVEDVVADQQERALAVDNARYAKSLAFLDDLATRPRVERPGLPKARREWNGKRVAVRYVKVRGNSRSRTSMGYVFGTLVTAENSEHVAIRESNGTVRNIHYKRVTSLYLMDGTRR